MFKSKDFIYIQMQKTGCSHISRLYSNFFEGIEERKHQPATVQEIESYHYFVSSIRNPWDWYLSLWTFGVENKGGLRNRLVNGESLKSDLNSNNDWLNVYNDINNVDSFRKWLIMIHQVENHVLLGENYGESDVTPFCGFMTHRYLYLCCREYLNISSRERFKNLLEIEKYEKKHNYIDFYIKQESLETDFCESINHLITLKECDLKFINGFKKTNASKRAFHISKYYDDSTIELVFQREKLIIDKFNYTPNW
jgi:hypothetical protein